MNCGVGHGCCLDVVWLWLWCRLAAVVPIRPLAWEPPCAAGAALKSKTIKIIIIIIKILKTIKLMNIYLDCLCNKRENVQMSNIMNKDGHIPTDLKNILGDKENMNNFMG